MKLTFFFALIFTLALIFTACKKEIDEKPAGQWSNSIFIVNEGPFQTGSGSISAFNRVTGALSHNLFENANGRPLGNIVQSIAVFKGKIFIAVNNSNKMEIASLKDFKSIATIDSLVLPRYFLGIDDERAYVSCWDNTVKEISLLDYSIVREIQTGSGPDEMVLSGERLFVINSGGFGVDSTVTYFNVNNKEIFGRLEVGHRPAGIAEDFLGNIWVLCSGRGWNGFPAPDDTPARLVCFDPVSMDIMKEITFPGTDHHPDNLVANDDGTMLFYNHPAGVFEFSVISGSLNEEPLIPTSKMFYGLGYDPDSRMLCVTDPLDYAQNGWVFRYSTISRDPVDSFQVGIIPNGFWFN